MGGQILEYEAKDILREGIHEGIGIGKIEGRKGQAKARGAYALDGGSGEGNRA